MFERYAAATPSGGVQTLTKTRVDVSSITLIAISVIVISLLMGIFTSHAAVLIQSLNTQLSFHVDQYDFFGVGESGTIFNINQRWRKVSFLKSYSSPPVVIVSPVGLAGAQPAHMRVRNVTNTDFELKVEEWDYMDKSHNPEIVNYVAVPEGNYYHNGFQFQAGLVDGVNQKWTTVKLAENFQPGGGVLINVLQIRQSDINNPNDPAILEYGDISKMYQYAEQGRKFEIRANIQHFSNNPQYVFPFEPTNDISDRVVFDCSEYDYQPKGISGETNYTGWITCDGQDYEIGGGYGSAKLSFSIPLTNNYIGQKVVATAKIYSTDGAYLFDDSLFVSLASVYLKEDVVKPIVLTQTQTYNGPAAIVTRNVVVASGTFRVRVQEEEAADQAHNKEQLGFLAIKPYQGMVLNSKVEAMTADNFKNTWKTIAFNQGFDAPPIFLANMQTANGSDTATLRYNKLSNDGVKLLVEEEQSKDSETNHVNETIGYFVIERPQVVTPRLTVYSYPSIIDQSVVAGTKDFPFAGLVLDASESEADISVTEINLMVHTNLTAPSDVYNFNIFDGNTQLTTTNDPDADTSAHTNPGDTAVIKFVLASPLTIGRGSSKTLVVKGSISAAADDGMYQVGPSSELPIQVVDAKGINGDPADLIVEHSNGPEILFLSSGNLIITRDASTPDTGLIPANSNGVILAIFNLVAQSEDINIEKIYLTAEQVNNGGWDQIDGFDVYTVDQAGNKHFSQSVTPTSTDGVDRTALFDSPVTVPKDSQIKLIFQATTADSNGDIGSIGASGQGLRLKINSVSDVVAKGLTSGRTLVGIDVIAASGNSQYLFRSVPVLTTNDQLSDGVRGGDIPVGVSEQPLYRFKIKAGSSNAVGLYYVTFLVNKENVDASYFTITDDSNNQLGATLYTNESGQVGIYLEDVPIVSGNSSKTFTLSANIDCTPNTNCGAGQNSYISISMLGDTEFPTPLPVPVAAGGNGSLFGPYNSRFGWTDFWLSPVLLNSDPDVTDKAQWSNGYLIPTANGSKMVPISMPVIFSR